ncbi:hypothetical protein B0T17DRAFT_234368 [Bombardia bombarda]|uniref:Peptidase S8/S53 domain-containing protein n=1 Tax=Bombardia bombarda TaxID=252184 RepID=A0AA39XBI2_9PEZI|nr:hypothetical protein B0T17DRAFT_234368 [Bombardia bombarda]
MTRKHFHLKATHQKLMVIGSADEDGDKSKFVNNASCEYLFPGEISIPDMIGNSDKGSSVATAIAAGLAAMILWCAEYHSLKTSSFAGNTSTIRSYTTAPEWNFRQDDRMMGLFKALRPAKDKFVDISYMVNGAITSVDENRESGDLITTQGAVTQRTYAGEFVKLCKRQINGKFPVE